MMQEEMGKKDRQIEALIQDIEQRLSPSNANGSR
jgi:hypothetical protein